MKLEQDFVAEIKKSIEGEIRTDLTTRLLYSTDASIYQIEPRGVVFPRHEDDLAAIVSLAGKYHIPLLPRGGGSSLAGQAIGDALIVDTSRYMTHILEINPEERFALVEPGVILSKLNGDLKRFGLTFGPDPASAERATVGGSIANNATGAHSIQYGMSADHLLAAKVLLSNGSAAWFQAMSVEDARRFRQNPQSDRIESDLYEFAFFIRDTAKDDILQRWPRVWRRSAGYNLNYLIPWSSAKPPAWESWQCGTALPYPPLAEDEINLAPLWAGSEGTLGLFSRLKIRLVPLPKARVLALLSFDSIVEACERTPELLAFNPTTIELIPGDLIALSRSVPAYARQFRFIEDIPSALLVVEFSADEQGAALAQAGRLGDKAVLVESAELQRQVWEVRKVGLGILDSRLDDTRPTSFIEDLSVPVEALGEFVREMEKLLRYHQAHAYYYAHASAGCLHIRPLINLKDKRGVMRLRSIAREAVALALGFGGVADGEHGDGLARSEWLKQTYGEEIYTHFRRLKTIVDPQNIFNPGKIIDPLPMDENLRYGGEYRAEAWIPVFNSSQPEILINKIELCNGAGVCRKDDGVMCPSFQATREEMHSTRGRANLLRALISGKFGTRQLGMEAVREALDLCLACKGCKAECPSAVDMAQLKYEFYQQYYTSHRRRLRDYVFAWIGDLAPSGSLVAPLLNTALQLYFLRKIGEKSLGLASRRTFPRFQSFYRLNHFPKPAGKPDVYLLSDAFTHYFESDIEKKTWEVLSRIGLDVMVLPQMGAGRTFISKGFLREGKQKAKKLVDFLGKNDPDEQIPIVGIEPSEVYCLRDEYLDFFPEDEKVARLAARSWTLEEYLLRVMEKTNLDFIAGSFDAPAKVLLHGHCYQKAQPPADDGLPVGVNAVVEILRRFGYTVEVVDSGCCGMAGAFGYETEHYALSMQIGEMKLFLAVRSADAETWIAASGTSCRAQIFDGTRRKAFHPVELIWRAMNFEKKPI